MAKKKIEKNVVESRKDSCTDEQCPFHGKLKVRGRQFKGYVIKKFPRRIVIEFERIIYIRKYERYAKKKTRIHARVSKCKENEVALGDYVIIEECRPLSKLIHFVYVRNISVNKEGISEHPKNSQIQQNFSGIKKVGDENVKK